MALIYEKESYEILGACFEVYKQMGPGFLEAVYQESLEIASKKPDIAELEKAEGWR